MLASGQLPVRGQVDKSRLKGPALAEPTDREAGSDIRDETRLAKQLRCGLREICRGAVKERVWRGTLAGLLSVHTSCEGHGSAGGVPEQRISVGIAAINAVVAWRIMTMKPVGRRVIDCGSGLKIADHDANFRSTMR